MKTIELDQSKYKELMAVSVWYDGMPTNTTFNAGDRFHENVWDFRMSCMPDDLLEGDQYFSHFELIGDDLFVIVMVDGETDEDEYKIVPKGQQ